MMVDIMMITCLGYTSKADINLPRSALKLPIIQMVATLDIFAQLSLDDLFSNIQKTIGRLFFCFKITCEI